MSTWKKLVVVALLVFALTSGVAVPAQAFSPKDAAGAVLDGVENGLQSGWEWVDDHLVPDWVKDALAKGLPVVGWVVVAGPVAGVAGYLTYKYLVPQGLKDFVKDGVVWVADEAGKFYRWVVPQFVQDGVATLNNWTAEHPATVLLATVLLTTTAPYARELFAQTKFGQELARVGGVVNGYTTSTGAVFKVPVFPRLREFCYSKGCGKFVAEEARDPKRFYTGQLREDVLDTVCGPKRCEVNGKRFPRSEAEVDHKVPHSCGGATTFANAQVLSKKDNAAKGGCKAA